MELAEVPYYFPQENEHLLGLPRRFASEVLMFFFREKLRVHKQSLKTL